MLASAKLSLLFGRMHVKAGEKEKCHVNLASQSIRVCQNTWLSHSALKLPCNSHNGRRVSLMIYMSGLGFPVIDMCFSVNGSGSQTACRHMLWRFTWQTFHNAELTCFLQMSAKWRAEECMAELRKCRIDMLIMKIQSKNPPVWSGGFCLFWDLG